MRWSLFAFLFLVFLPKEALAWCVARTCNGDQENCRRNADGCAVDGEYLNWKDMPVQFRFDDHGSEKLDTTVARQVIRRAFEAWSNVDCEDGRTSLRFHEESDIVQSRRDRENGMLVPFAIHFRDDNWPHEGEDNTLAKTTFVNTKVTGYLREVAMEINTRDKKFSLTDEDEGDYDLQAVVTHEVGHWIGIAHSNVPGSIMEPHYCQSSKRCGKSIDRARSLSDDDIAVVCAVYPPGPEARKSNACAARAPPRSSGWPLLLSVLAIVIPLARRRCLQNTRFRPPPTS